MKRHVNTLSIITEFYPLTLLSGERSTERRGESVGSVNAGDHHCVIGAVAHTRGGQHHILKYQPGIVT